METMVRWLDLQTNSRIAPRQLSMWACCVRSGAGSAAIASQVIAADSIRREVRRLIGS